MSPLTIVLTLMCVSNGVVFGRYVENIWSKNNEDACPRDPNCSSTIYCVGQFEKDEYSILHEVQTSGLPKYKDGTKFVKLEMKHSEKEILKKYKNYLAVKHNTADDRLKTELLIKFIEDNFYDTNHYLDTNVTLIDFTDNPPFLQNDLNEDLRTWLLDLNAFWKTLARRLNSSLEKETSEHRRSSYIYVPNTFIVAGGRFDEMYYWDSYWIIEGLLACGMTETSRGIIENMIHLVKQFGYVPNGNRIYYLGRSQPPMLIQMVNAYYDTTTNSSFIENNLEELSKEFKWWVENRMVNVTKDGKDYTFFHYNAVSCDPRPESYKEDYNLLVNYTGKDKNAKEKKVYSGIRSAAESGWDFSSKHMVNPELSSKAAGLMDMNPAQFVYVELNSIMYSNAKLLADWYRNFSEDENNMAKSEYFSNLAENIFNGIENVLWDNEEGIWFDYDINSGKSRKYFYASNFAPLWSKAYTDLSKVEKVVKYLENHTIIYMNLTSKYYGVPTTDSDMVDSEQQWDFPNVWPPLQSFIIRGLKESNNTDAEKVAYNLATSFLDTTYAAYYKTPNHTMYEKYNATSFGMQGEKGEYPCQTGFGWTNGFVFELFSMWSCFPITVNGTKIDCTNSKMV